MDHPTNPAAWPPSPPTFPPPQQLFPFPADNNNHQPLTDPPPYPEMIIAAITALKEKEGSSRQAIGKYIQSVFPNLPPDHPTLLTWHLKKMKTEGSLAMVKYSYSLPGSVPDSVPAPTPENLSPTVSATPTETKRGRGRPPKAKSPAQPTPMTVVPFSEPNAETMLVSLGLVDGPSPASSPTPVKRGRGRPPRAQNGSASTGPATSGSAVEKRSRGRPPRAIRAATLHPPARLAGLVGSVGPRKRGRPAKAGGKARGRPRKVVLVGAVAGSVGGVAVKRRGRPPRAGGPVRKLRRLSGKPLGRPRKNAMGPGNQVAAQNMVAYEDLKNKAEHLQSRVKQAVDLVRPYFTSENAPYVYGALQELEELANMDMTAPPQAPPEAQPQPPVPPVTQS